MSEQKRNREKEYSETPRVTRSVTRRNLLAELTGSSVRVEAADTEESDQCNLVNPVVNPCQGRYSSVLPTRKS